MPGSTLPRRETEPAPSGSRSGDCAAARPRPLPHSTVLPMPASAAPDPHYARRWTILAVLGVAQLMVVLDATIVNIALPTAQKALAFSDDDRQWIITAYALAFGSLLLIGGRVGDLFGRKFVFVAGLVGFALASAVGGAAQSFGVLVAARAGQGVFGALLAPGALSLLTTIFHDPAERGKAFGIFGAIAGGGAAIGLLLGGVLTEYLTWRWCLYVNLVFAIPAAIAALALLHHLPHPDKPRLDLAGTATATLGLLALVFGLARAEQDGWGSRLVVGCLVASVVLLTVFIVLQRRVANPLMPLRIVLDRARGGAYLAVLISGAGMFAVFLFLTYYLQQTLGMSPIETGLGFLPMSAAIMVTATLGNIRLVPTIGPRRLISVGMILGAAGLALLARLEVDSSYAGHVLPALLVMGVGMGLIFAPAFVAGTLGVGADDAGVASATINTAQQVGGSIGTALLSTLFSSAVSTYASSHAPSPELAGQAAMHGYTTAFWWAAGIFVIGALVAALVLPPGVPRGIATGEPALAH